MHHWYDGCAWSVLHNKLIYIYLDSRALADVSQLYLVFHAPTMACKNIWRVNELSKKCSDGDRDSHLPTYVLIKMLFLLREDKLEVLLVNINQICSSFIIYKLIRMKIICRNLYCGAVVKLYPGNTNFEPVK